MNLTKHKAHSVAVASLAELSALETAVVSHFDFEVFTVRIRRWKTCAGKGLFAAEVSHDGVDSEAMKAFIESLEFPDMLFGELPASLRQKSSSPAPPPVTITSMVIVNPPD